MGIRFDLDLNSDIEPQIINFFSNLEQLFINFEKPLTFDIAYILSEIQDVINREVQKELKSEVQNEFLNESDPYGNKWPIKKIPTGTPQMVVSGKLKNSFRVQKAQKKDNKWQITNNVEYAEYLQEGTSKMLKRQMLPTSLPDSWKANIYDAILSAIDMKVQQALDLL